MTINTCSTCSALQTNEVIFCMGSDMETCTLKHTNSLPLTERLAITASLGWLLTAFGSLLQEHPELQAELSPETGEILVRVGEKLTRASTNPGAW